MELDLLSLDSVVSFAEAWNARLGPLHVLINNAGIFSIGGWFDNTTVYANLFVLIEYMTILIVSVLCLRKKNKKTRKKGILGQSVYRSSICFHLDLYWKHSIIN